MFHSILPTSLKSRRAAQKSEMKSTDRWNKFQFEIRNTNNKSHISIEFSCESAYVHMLSPQSHCVRVMQTTVRIQRELGTECAHTHTQRPKYETTEWMCLVTYWYVFHLTLKGRKFLLYYLVVINDVTRTKSSVISGKRISFSVNFVPG